MSESDLLSQLNQILSVFGGVSVAMLQIAAPSDLVAQSCQCHAASNGNVIPSGVT
jgi:hypothetical protein